MFIYKVTDFMLIEKYFKFKPDAEHYKNKLIKDNEGSFPPVQPEIEEIRVITEPWNEDYFNDNL